MRTDRPTPPDSGESAQPNQSAQPAAPRPSPSSVLLSPRTPLSAALSAWEAHMQSAGLAENTVKAFIGDLRLLGRFQGMGHPIGEIATFQLNAFLRWLEHDRGVPCSPKSYARRVTSLKSFFKWLADSGVLPGDPAAPVIQRSVSSPLPEILFADEVAQVLSVARSLRRGDAQRRPDARPYVLISLILTTGIKKSEAMAIAPNHVDLSNPEIPALYIRYSNPRLRHKERKLKLDPQWPAALAEYREQYQPRERLFECTARNLEYVLTDVGQAAGLTKPLSFETIRWTCAVRDFSGGMPPETLRLKLGLSKITWRETEEKLVKLASTPL